MRLGGGNEPGGRDERAYERREPRAQPVDGDAGADQRETGAEQVGGQHGSELR